MSTVKTRIPDGNGGWLEVEGDAMQGMEADPSKQQAAMSKQWYEEVNGLIEWFWKQGRLYQSENGLTEEQVAFAVSLLQVNCRQAYPEKLGGPAAFDKLHEAAWAYYTEATKK